MITNIGIHLIPDDKWSVTDYTDSSDPFVCLAIHEATSLFVRHKTIDALIAAVNEAKALLDKVSSKAPEEPS